jgi:predicted nuclease of predicted toxin-antitoxin system
MKFLVDAQLPRKIARILQHTGYDAIHTLDLPQQNRTKDSVIITIAEQEQRIIITKDADFVESFILFQRPSKLLVVTTGNISNQVLETLFLAALPQITEAFRVHSYVELSRMALIIHQ